MKTAVDKLDIKPTNATRNGIKGTCRACFGLGHLWDIWDIGS